MIKRISFIIACLTLLCVTTASAQVKFGVKGGLNMSEFSLSGDYISKSNNTGFYIGPTVKLKIPLLGFGVDASLLYDQRSVDVTVNEGSEEITESEEKLKQKQLAIPINLRYNIGLGDMASIFFFAGPQFAFNLADDIDHTDFDWKWKNTYLSINLGAGATLINHLQVNLNYNIGCGKTGEASASSVAHDAIHGKSHAWQLGLAYYF